MAGMLRTRLCVAQPLQPFIEWLKLPAPVCRWGDCSLKERDGLLQGAQLASDRAGYEIQFSWTLVLGLAVVLCSGSQDKDLVSHACWLLNIFWLHTWPGSRDVYMFSIVCRAPHLLASISAACLHHSNPFTRQYLTPWPQGGGWNSSASASDAYIIKRSLGATLWHFSHFIRLV
jgi:hypothetical protein